MKVQINAGTIHHQVVVEHMDEGTIAFPQRTPPDRADLRTKILVFAANPSSTTALALDEEVRAVGRMIREAEHREDFELVSHWASRADDLLQQMNEQRPTIVQFSGHGADDGGLVLHADHGVGQRVPPGAIAALFQAARGQVRVVVFNTCGSLAQAEAVARVVDCVVGMDGAIGDVAARTFAASFYRALGFGCSVGDAFEQGRAALLLAGIREEDTPRLLTRLGVDARRVVLGGPRTR